MYPSPTAPMVVSEPTESGAGRARGAPASLEAGGGGAATGAAQPRLLVVHAAADEWFVRGALLPALHLPPGDVQVTCKLALGGLALAELERRLSTPALTVVVRSQAFEADAWSGLVGLLARRADRGDGDSVWSLVLDAAAAAAAPAAQEVVDLRDRGRWEEAFARLRARLGQPSAPALDELPCPYPGPRPYRAEDAPLFFGREREIVELVQHLRGGAREVLLVGPHGSGKSSLVTAGVLPRLARGVFGMPPLVVRALRPGPAPARSLGAVLDGPLDDLPAAVDRVLAGHPGGARLLLFVDQAEELATSVGSSERAAFGAALAALRRDGRVGLVWALRADPPLAGAARGGAFASSSIAGVALDRDDVVIVNLPPLRGEALRAAVLRPAHEVGAVFEPGLLESVLGAVEQAPCALADLQATLVQLWARRLGRLLTAAPARGRAESPRAA